MEVSLLGAQGVPEGCLLSLRVGTTRRQGPAVPETLKLRFPRGFTGVDNFKVDVLAPVSSKTVELEGAGKYRVPVGSDPHCQVLLELAEIDRDAGPIPNIDKAFASSALPKGTIPSDGESPSASRRHRAALSARQYLDEHRLLGWAQTLFQDLIRSRPKDPWAFIDEQTRLAKKLAETERKQSPELDDEQPPADVAALTMPMKINRIAEGVLTLGKQLQDRMKELEEEAESGARRKENPAEALQEISEGLSALSRELALRVQQLEEGGLWIPMKKSWEHSAGSASSTRHPGSTLEDLSVLGGFALGDALNRQGHRGNPDRGRGDPLLADAGFEVVEFVGCCSAGSFSGDQHYSQGDIHSAQISAEDTADVATGLDDPDLNMDYGFGPPLRRRRFLILPLRPVHLRGGDQSETQHGDGLGRHLQRDGVSLWRPTRYLGEHEQMTTRRGSLALFMDARLGGHASHDAHYR